MLTTKTDPRASSGRLRYTYELLFALNLAFVAQLEGNQKPNRLFSFLEWGELGLRLKIAEYFHLHAHSDFASGTAFFAYSLGFALLIFLLLRASARAVATQKLLQVAGILSLVALPASWLLVAQRMGWWFTLFSASLIYAGVAELVIAMLCAVAYLHAKWPLPLWGNAALVLAHFAFWQVVCFGPYFWRGPIQSIVTFSGLFSALAWGIYISQQRSITTRASSG